MHALARTALITAAAAVGVLTATGMASAATGPDCAAVGLRCEVVHGSAGAAGILVSPADDPGDPDRSAAAPADPRPRTPTASTHAAPTAVPPTDDPTTSAPADPTTTDGATARDDDGREDADTGITAARTAAPTEAATDDDPAAGGASAAPRIDLAQWSLTLPTGTQGHPDTIEPADLPHTSNDDFHPTDDNTGLVLSAPADGVTTGGSEYPRSELREVDGDRDAAWTNTHGTHTLDLREAITAVPAGKPEVVGAQIHDGHDDVVQVRLEGTKLLVAADDGHTTRVLDPAYKLGTPYRVRIVAADSRVSVQYNDAAPVTLPLSGTGWYFKVGAYVQANAGQVADPRTTGEVVVYSATVRHDGAPASSGDTGTDKSGKSGKAADDKKKGDGDAARGKATGHTHRDPGKAMAPTRAARADTDAAHGVVNDGPADDPALGDGRAQVPDVDRTANVTPTGGTVTGHSTGDTPAGARVTGAATTTLPGEGQYAGLPDGTPTP